MPYQLNPWSIPSSSYSFAILNVTVPFLYYSKYLKVDEDDFGQAELLKEGFQASFGVFMVRQSRSLPVSWKTVPMLYISLKLKIRSHANMGNTSSLFCRELTCPSLFFSIFCFG